MMCVYVQVMSHWNSWFLWVRWILTGIFGVCSSLPIAQLKRMLFRLHLKRMPISA